MVTVQIRSGPRRNLSFVGPCSIAGPITGVVAGTQVRVMLLSWPGMFFARNLVTQESSYSFDKVAEGEWVVIARDEAGNFNMVSKDRVVTRVAG